MNSTTTPCDDVRTARLALEFFSAFRDKAFKAFYARKILQLPPVIAAQVFDVSNGLISQAAGDRNVYTVANRSNSSSNELGVFNLPGGGVVATTMNNDGRQEIFKALTRIAIIKNRGVDVPNFQNRMVAGYMSESDADAFRAGMQTIARVYANCPEMDGGRRQPEDTASDSNNYSEGLAYRRTNTIQLSGPQREGAILDLIAAGTDRDTAQQFVSELNALGFNFSSPMRSGNELSYRLFYFGNMSDAVSSADVLAMMASTLRLGPTDISMGLRNDDLQGTITFPSQAASAGQGAIRSIFINDRERTAVNTWFDNNGFADTREDFYQAIREDNLEIVLESRATRELRLFIRKTSASNFNQDIIGQARTLKGILAGPENRSDPRQRERYRLINYSRMTRTEVSFRILRYDESAEPESTATPVLEYTRLMQELGYSEMDTSTILNAMNSADLEILSCQEGGGTFYMVVRSSRDTFQVIQVRQLFRLEWQRMADREGSGTTNRPSVIVGDEPNTYLVTINGPEHYGLTPASSSTEAAEPQSTTTQRRNIFTDPILASRTINWFRDNGYQDTYEAFFDLVSATPTAMITVQDESPRALKITVATTDGSQIPRREMKAALAGPRGAENQRVRYGQIAYTINAERTSVSWRIFPFDSGFEESTTTPSATTSPAQAAGNEQVQQLATEYDTGIVGTRLREMFTREQFVQLKLAGYSVSQLRSFNNLFRQRNLAVNRVMVKRTPRGGFRKFIQIDVRRGPSGMTPRAMRNQNYQSWLRSVLNMSDVRVSVSREGATPFLQMAGFRRGSGTGYFILPSLVGDSIPVLNSSDREYIRGIQSGQTGESQMSPPRPQASQEFDPQGDPGVAGQSNPTSSTAPPTGTRTRNVKLNRTIGIEIEGDMPFAREANMSIEEYFKLRMRQWCEANGQPKLKVGYGLDKYTFGRDGSVRGVVPFEVDSPALVPANIDPATTSLPADFIRENKFDSDVALWNQIRTFCESLQYSGVRIHISSCFHIHVSVADYTPEDFERYVYNYASF